jgi:hypothetical protein
MLFFKTQNSAANLWNNSIKRIYLIADPENGLRHPLSRESSFLYWDSIKFEMDINFFKLKQRQSQVITQKYNLIRAFLLLYSFTAIFKTQ